MSVSVTINEETRSVTATVSRARGPVGAAGPQGATGATGATGPQGDTGPEGPPGSDAEVTQANMSAAITEKDDFRQTLQLGPDLVQNQGALLPFWKKLLPLQTSTPTSATWLPVWGMGDSMGTGNGPTPRIMDMLSARYGVGGLVSGSFAGTTNAIGTYLNATLGGSSTLHPSGYNVTVDLTYWLNGRYYKIPSGSSVTEAPFDASIVVGWSKIKFFYGYRTSGGSLSFDVKLNGATISGGAQVVSTAAGGGNTAGTIGVLEVDSGDGLKNHGALSIVATASTAECHYLGCVVYLQRGGIIAFQAGVGSHTYDEQDAVAEANWTKFATELGCALTFSATKGETESGITEHVRKLAALLPTSAHVLIGNSPTQATPALDEADNEIYRGLAMANNMAFINGNAFGISYDFIDDQGEGGDAVHLSTDWNRIFAAFICPSFLHLAAPSPDGALSGDRLMTYNEWQLRSQVCNTRVYCPLTSDLADSGTSTGWTFSKAQATVAVNWTTSAGADTLEGIRIRESFPFGSDDDVMFGFSLLENFSTTSNVSVRMGFGINDQPTLAIDRKGLYWEFGFDSSTTPWVRFIIYTDAGVTHTTDKHYIPIATGGAGYKTGAVYPNSWVIRFDGFNSATKRLRCWVCPEKSSNSANRTEKPLLICDTTLTLASSTAVSPNSSYNICFQGIVRTSSPASNGSAKLLSFWYDRNPEDAAVFRNR